MEVGNDCGSGGEINGWIVEGTSKIDKHINNSSTLN